MSFEVIFSVGLSVCALVSFAFAVAYRPRPHDIDNVILLARKLDLADLEGLFDSANEWKLRRSLGKWALREIQQDRMRLAQEYVRRVAHNVSLIQLWVIHEHEAIQAKRKEEYTERDLLVVEALQLATDLRLYSLTTSVRLWLWTALKAYRWPLGFIPNIGKLKVQSGVNGLERYRQLTELAVALSAQYGNMYHDELVRAL